MVFIYGLIDQQSNQLKYIGSTFNVKNRVQQHKSVDKLDNNSMIDYLILDEVDKGRYYWENFYIEYYNSLGCSLLNKILHSKTNINEIPKPTITSKVDKDLLKEAEELLKSRTQSLNSISNDYDISLPTLSKIRNGKKVSKKTLVYLKDCLE